MAEIKHSKEELLTEIAEKMNIRLDQVEVMFAEFENQLIERLPKSEKIYIPIGAFFATKKLNKDGEKTFTPKMKLARGVFNELNGIEQ